MNFAKVLGIFAVIIVVGMLICGGCLYKGYNRAVALDEGVKQAWSEVDNQLQRRFELVPNLVETVKGVAAQEEKIFLGVAEARKAYTQAQTIPEKARAAGGFESALSRLLMIKEQYPQLRSNESFLKLQDSLEGTENRLAVARKRYNDAVSTLNTFTRKLLGRFYSSLASVGPAEYFEIEEAARTAPEVDFSDQSGKD